MCLLGAGKARCILLPLLCQPLNEFFKVQHVSVKCRGGEVYSASHTFADLFTLRFERTKVRILDPLYACTVSLPKLRFFVAAVYDFRFIGSLLNLSVFSRGWPDIGMRSISRRVTVSPLRLHRICSTLRAFKNGGCKF